MAITYKVQPENASCCGVSSGPDVYKPKVYLDTSNEMAGKLAIGDDCTVILKGKITGIQLREREENPASFDLELSTITLQSTSKNPAQDIVDDEGEDY